MPPPTQIRNLNQTQLEILKLFSRELKESDLIEIKRLIIQYLAGKITETADEIWELNNWTNDDMKRLLNTPKKTSYSFENRSRH